MVSDGGNILNFSRFRKISRDKKKQQDRAEKEAKAAANRVRFGRTGAEKKMSRLIREKDDRAHNGQRRETSPSDDKREPEDPGT